MGSSRLRLLGCFLKPVKAVSNKVRGENVYLPLYGSQYKLHSSLLQTTEANPDGGSIYLF